MKPAANTAGWLFLSRKMGIVCLINVKEGEDYPSSGSFPDAQIQMSSGKSA